MGPEPAPLDADVLFFSRGRGRGHAIPDLAVLRDLRTLCPDVRVQFVSYAVGADVFRAAGEPVIDLGLPEMNPLLETVIRAVQVMRRTSSACVVSHEEPAALAAARICGRPALFMSHWYPLPPDPTAQALQYADRVLFMEHEGLFPEPPEIAGRIDYVGPVLRHLDVRRADRELIRAELGVGGDDVLLLMLAGSPDESVTPTIELVLHAFESLSTDRKQLIWVSSKNQQQLRNKIRHRPGVRIIDTDWQLERLMVACDVAITKGTYNIGRELSALGVPTVVLSHGYNPIDDLFARRLDGCRFLWARETSATELAKLIETTVRAPLPLPAPELLAGVGRRRLAARLMGWLEAATRGASTSSGAPGSRAVGKRDGREDSNAYDNGVDLDAHVAGGNGLG